MYAAASEDMDTLTFGAPRLVRRLWGAEKAEMPILEISHDKILSGLELTEEQFVDVCILAGCDYAEPIKGIAATTALKEVKKHGSLKGVVESIDASRLPKDVDYDEVRQLFLHPEVLDPEKVELKWTEPDEAGLIKYLCEEKGFNEARIQGGIAKLRKARQGGNQVRMDAFLGGGGARAGAGTSSAPAIVFHKPAGVLKRKVRGRGGCVRRCPPLLPPTLTPHPTPPPPPPRRRRRRRQKSSRPS